MGINNILLIGSGQIAGGYDSPDSKKVLTHLGAINNIITEKIIIDIVEPELSNYLSIKKKWNITGKHYYSIKEIKLSKYDIILITCNTSFHFEIIKYSVENINCKIILCEKPCCSNLDEIINVDKLCKSKDIKLYVNYQRRLISEWNLIKNEIGTGGMGEFQFGNVYYSKGLVNNCSHAINLILYIFNKSDLSIKNIFEHFYDYSKSDPTLTFSLELNDKVINFIGLNDQNFSIFEIDLIFQKARIKCIDSGTIIRRYNLSEDSLYSGFKSLNYIKNKDDKTEPFLNLWRIIESKEFYKLEDISINEAINTFRLLNQLKIKC